MTLDQWALFVGVWFAAGLPLGPNAANCIAVAAQHGFSRALWAVGGILVASLLFMATITLGLGAILLANAALFSALKLAGAAYLIWMGVSLFRRNGGALEDQTVGATTFDRWSTLRQSCLISLSNPKAIIAYGAIFSQFISTDVALAPQIAVLAPTAWAIVATIYLGYAGLGLGVKRILATAARRRVFDRCIGGFYVFAGAALIAGEAQHLRAAR